MLISLLPLLDLFPSPSSYHSALSVEGNILLDDCYGDRVKFWVTCLLLSRCNERLSFLPTLGKRKKK